MDAPPQAVTSLDEPIPKRNGPGGSTTSKTGNSVSSSRVSKLRGIRASIEEVNQQQLAIYTGPADKNSYFKLLQDELDQDILNTVSQELVQPPKEAVFTEVMDGKTVVNCDLTQV